MITFLALSFAQVPTSNPLGTSKKPIVITFDPYMDDLEEFAQKPEIQKLADEVRHYSFQLILLG
jgi:hypothetical protein